MVGALQWFSHEVRQLKLCMAGTLLWVLLLETSFTHTFQHTLVASVPSLSQFLLSLLAVNVLMKVEQLGIHEVGNDFRITSVKLYEQWCTSVVFREVCSQAA